MSARVGILGFQGCIEPHEAMFALLGATCARVRTPEELSRVERLIMPGGESTTMLKFLNRTGMTGAIKEFAKERPVWGICAGAILAAREVYNPQQPSLDLIDVKAHRNFYGPQTESFTEQLTIELTKRFSVEAHFIRAPLLDPLPVSNGRKTLEICAYSDKQPVMFKQGNVWACSFHVELGEDTELHEAFLAL
jgi:5'-phosphate synthase pdxT subunit